MTRIEFRGKLAGMGPGRAWTRLELPKNSIAKFGTRGMARVRGTINGFGIRTSVQPSGKGTHVMMVNKLMQAGAKAKPVDRVRVVLELDTRPRIVKVPADLQKAINASAKAKALFAEITSRAREDWVQWIGDAKQAENRARRIALAVKPLGAGKRRHDQ